MFNVGGGELLVILLVALIVLGPERLPDAARKIGHAMGEVRRMSSGFQSEIRTAFEDADPRSTSTPAPHRLEPVVDDTRSAGTPTGTAPEQVDEAPQRRSDDPAA